MKVNSMMFRKKSINEIEADKITEKRISVLSILGNGGEHYGLY